MYISDPGLDNVDVIVAKERRGRSTALGDSRTHTRHRERPAHAQQRSQRHAHSRIYTTGMFHSCSTDKVAGCASWAGPLCVCARENSEQLAGCLHGVCVTRRKLQTPGTAKEHKRRLLCASAVPGRKHLQATQSTVNRHTSQTRYHGVCVSASWFVSPQCGFSLLPGQANRVADLSKELWRCINQYVLDRGSVAKAKGQPPRARSA